MLEKSGTAGLALRFRIGGQRYIAVAIDLRYSSQVYDLEQARKAEKGTLF